MSIGRPARLTLVLALSFAAHALAVDTPVTGKKLLLKTEPVSTKRKFLFKTTKESAITPTFPSPFDAAGAALLVYGVQCTGTPPSETCTVDGSSELITLDPSMWKPLGNPPGSKGYKYKDKDSTQGGVKVVLIKDEKLIVKALGPNWPWVPTGPVDRVRVDLRIADEWFCAEFGGEEKKNEAGSLLFKNASAPGGCADVCGNGEIESPEECDDGNLIDGDGCESDCTLGPCGGLSFNSTFEAIQTVIFDNYGCTNSSCHGAAAQGGLDLTSAVAYDNLIRVPSTIDPATSRVEPGDQDLSMLWLKLAEKTLGDSSIAPGGGMPSGATPAISLDELQGVMDWIRGGAPETGVVEGTDELFNSCLPDPEPGKIPPPDPPTVGSGVQVLQTPWPLPAQSESEICMATLYDFTAPGLVPASAKVNCPWGSNTINPTGECILWHHQTLYQDPQSHHSIIEYYRGSANWNDVGWGSWTYKGGPNEGQSCDPTAVDATGINPGCSSSVVVVPACIGFGPSDYGASTTTDFSGSQEPLYSFEFADGVYSLLPIRGIIGWNSHAFNLTNFNSTMEQYLNIEFAGAADQLYQAQAIFDDNDIFVQNVPPFETREYCDQYIIPSGANLFHLNSHVHKRGVLFRIWEPPNSSCGSNCTAPAGAPIYTSTDYSDPVQMYFSPPDVYTGTTSNRRFVYCALYDNGATDIQDVKRRSTSPSVLIGGPCAVSETRCIGGPQHNQLCNGDNSFCDSSPGAGDGDCDACPLRGGLSTEDEMLIMLGTYYVP